MNQERVDFEFEFFCESCGYTRKDSTHYYVGGGVPENGILPKWIFKTWERKGDMTKIIGDPSPPTYCGDCDSRMLARWEP